MLRAFRGRWWMAPLILSGLALIGLGGAQWAERRAPTAAVEQFLAALKDGDETAAVALLADELSAVLPPGVDRAAVWAPLPEFRSQIRSVAVSGNGAVIETRLTDGRYTLQPHFRLVRSAAGDWKIAEIANCRPDPRWVEVERLRQVEQDELLAQELEQALRDLPGVLVDRRLEDGPVRR